LGGSQRQRPRAGAYVENRLPVADVGKLHQQWGDLTTPPPHETLVCGAFREEVLLHPTQSAISSFRDYRVATLVLWLETHCQRPSRTIQTSV
jgi:hypothetical protein